MALNDLRYFAFKSHMGQNWGPSLNLSIWILISGAKFSFLRLRCISDDTGCLSIDGWDHRYAASPHNWNFQGNFAQVKSKQAHMPKGFVGKGDSHSPPSTQGINKGNKKRNCIIN